MTTQANANGKPGLAQLGGIGALLRNPGLVLHTLSRGSYVGTDSLGNHYFQDRRRAKFGSRPRRWVVYAGIADPSAVPPEWHAWLHHITDDPLPEHDRRIWQKPHERNATGTPAGYRPAGHEYQGGARARSAADYQSWTPDL